MLGFALRAKKNSSKILEPCFCYCDWEGILEFLNSRIRKSSLVRCWAVQAKIFKKHSQERALHL
ncbi:hypothetical protein [Campylobacter sp.]|uniref:hypothetical protein n=1 Tax=Campylobacter sp. TaxID=205 RepID=UPI002AA92AA1|nr:hypothetical protein [Campylobacter sp.]MCI7447163.1 hypothetical protein [Campylobacter sp.]